MITEDWQGEILVAQVTSVPHQICQAILNEPQRRHGVEKSPRKTEEFPRFDLGLFAQLAFWAVEPRTRIILRRHFFLGVSQLKLNSQLWIYPTANV